MGRRTAIALAAIALLTLPPPPVLAAKAKAGRSSGMLVKRPLPALHLTPASPDVELPPWLDWAVRVARGDAFTTLRPSWHGATPLGHWRLGLDAGLKGIGGLGYGAGFELKGSLRHRGWHLDGQLGGLWAPPGLGGSLEVAFAAAPLGIRLRTWQEPGASSPAQSATLTLRQSF